MTTFLLVRHGMTDDIGHVLSGWNDVPINAEGRAAVRALSARLSQARIAAIYTSPLERARETAQLIAAPHRLALRVEPDVGEVRYGAFTGRRFEELASEPAWLHWNTFRSATRVPDGETMAEVQARVLAALLRMRAAHPREQVVVVSHGDAIKAALASVLGSPIELMLRIEIDPASVTTLAIADDSARVVGVNRQS